MLAVWSHFYPHLMPRVPGCPNPLADQALRDSAREFMTRTRIWREWLEPLPALANAVDYDIEVPTGASAVRIERATLNGRPLDVKSHSMVGAGFGCGGQGLVSRDRISFVLTRSATPGAAIALDVSLKPSLTAPGVPDDLFEQHMESLVHGALYRLKMPGAPFDNAASAAIARGLFEAAINTQAVVAWRGATGTTPRPRIGWV